MNSDPVNLGSLQEPTDKQAALILNEMAGQRAYVEKFGSWQPSHMEAVIDGKMEIVMNRWEVSHSRLRVISTVGMFGVDPETAVPWWHLSVSHPKRTPTWEKMVQVKETLLGQDSEAYMVCPPRSEYVNFHSTTLHWWSRLDGQRVLPEMSLLMNNGMRMV